MRTAANASFAFCAAVVFAAFVVLKVTHAYEDTNRLGGWWVGTFSGVFFGSFAVWSAVLLAGPCRKCPTPSERPQ
jgi:hypothetical protein